MKQEQNEKQRLRRRGLGKWGVVSCSVVACLIAVMPVLAAEKPPKMTVTTLYAEKYTGTLLYATDTTLVLWQSKKPYDPNELEKRAVVFHHTEIRRIVVWHRGRFWRGVARGALIGVGTGIMLGLLDGNDQPGIVEFTAGQKAGMLGSWLSFPGAIIGGIVGGPRHVVYDHVLTEENDNRGRLLAKLNKYALFPDAVPPELNVFAQQRIYERFSSTSSPAARSRRPSWPPPPAKFHISLAIESSSTEADESIVEAFESSGFGGRSKGGWFAGPTDYPTSFGKSPTWEFAAEYNLTDRVRLGFTRSQIPQHEIQGIDYEDEYARGTCHSLLVEYVLFPVARESKRPLEVAIAAGPSYNSLTVEGILSTGSIDYRLVSPVFFVVKKKVGGAHIRGSLDYYLSKNLSVQSRINVRLMPAIEVPAVSYTNPETHRVKTLRAHSVDFNSLGFSCGLRFHL